jgi:hypothetical protein
LVKILLLYGALRTAPARARMAAVTGDVGDHLGVGPGRWAAMSALMWPCQNR